MKVSCWWGAERSAAWICCVTLYCSTSTKLYDFKRRAPLCSKSQCRMPTFQLTAHIITREGGMHASCMAAACSGATKCA